MAAHPEPTLHILEGGFRPRPEQLAAYGKRHEEFLPHAVAQPGFRETYGGPIAGGPWWFFVAKFDSLEHMEQWQANRSHIEVQDQARHQWWTAYYIRKGRLLAPTEPAAGLVLCETAILREARFSPEEHGRAAAALAQMSEFTVVPYETLSGERIQTPYVLAGPLGIIPQRAPIHYVVLTYWRNTTDCARWQESSAYRQIADLGQVHSTLFVIVPERGARLGLRADRMQREWVAKE